MSFFPLDFHQRATWVSTAGYLSVGPGPAPGLRERILKDMGHNLEQSVWWKAQEDAGLKALTGAQP